MENELIIHTLLKRIVELEARTALLERMIHNLSRTNVRDTLEQLENYGDRLQRLESNNS